MNRLALAAGILLSSWLIAAPPAIAADLNVAVINLPEVFDGYRMTKDLEQRFEDRRRNISAEAEQRRKNIETQIAALEAFDPASQDYQNRRDAVMRAQVEFQIWLSMEEQRLKDEHMAWLLKIYQDVQNTVGQAAKARNVDLVLTYEDLSPDVPDSLTLRREILLKKVLYFSDRTDLTQTVLASLNEAYNQRGGASSLGGSPPPAPLPVRPQTPRQ